MILPSGKKSRWKKDHKAVNEVQVIRGVNSVVEALQARPQHVSEIFIKGERKGKRFGVLLKIARQNGIPVTENRDIFEKTDGDKAEPTSQGVAARVILPIYSLEDLLGKLKKTKGASLVMALDSIQDPHNLGAIIRSAAAAGVDGLILPKNRSVSITETVIRVSAGAVFHLDIYRVTNLVNSFKKLKKEGIWIFGTAMHGATSLFDSDLTVPACLVIGSEGKGLRPLVAEHCDIFLSIPMHGSLDSLNASVAAGIILFEAVRQRKEQG
jgi:23S rRNA (guanosine2251-2'-O)-methyltransferase